MIVLCWARGLPLCPPAPLPGITRVNAMNILGVALRDDLKAADHVDTIPASISIRPPRLRLLRAQGLPSPALHIHSFIHSGHFYSAPSSPLPLRGAPDYSTDTVSEFHAEAHRQL